MSEVTMTNCPQCGNAVSTESKSCPNPYNGQICGFNVSGAREKGTMVILGLIVAAICIYWVYSQIVAFFS